MNFVKYETQKKTLRRVSFGKIFETYAAITGAYLVTVRIHRAQARYSPNF